MFARMFFDAELTTWSLFFEMVIAGAIVIFSGSKLTKMADEVADRLNLGAGWIGLILLATVTSLPELVSGGTAVGIGNPDLAFGAVLGSCSFNITIIVLLNAILGGGSILRRANSSHVLTSSFGAFLLGLTLFGILIIQKFQAQPAIARVIEIAWVLIILVAYPVFMWLTYSFERHIAVVDDGTPERRPVGTLLTLKLAALSCVLIVASWWLAKTGDVLSGHKIEMLGRPLGATLVGAGFLALATSLPEIATSIAAVRIGNLDLALGNIFGSNMFNIFTIPFFKAVSLWNGNDLMAAGPSFNVSQNLIAGVLPVILTAIAVAGLTYRGADRRARRFGFDSIMIGLTYICGIALLTL